MSSEKAITGLKSKIYQPNPKEYEVYRELYALYKTLHDAFGTRGWSGNLHNITKKLIEIRSRVRE